MKRQFIAIGTGGPTGVYFVVGNTICRLVHKEAAEGRKKGRKHGIRCSAPSTGGSTYNIGQIAAGELDFGVAQSDWQYHAYNGTSKKVTHFKKLRAVFSVHPEPYHIIVGKGFGDRFLGRPQGQAIQYRQSGLRPARHHRGADEGARNQGRRLQARDRADLDRAVQGAVRRQDRRLWLHRRRAQCRRRGWRPTVAARASSTWRAWSRRSWSRRTPSTRSRPFRRGPTRAPPPT